MSPADAAMLRRAQAKLQAAFDKLPPPAPGAPPDEFWPSYSARCEISGVLGTLDALLGLHDAMQETPA